MEILSTNHPSQDFAHFLDGSDLPHHLRSSKDYSQLQVPTPTLCGSGTPATHSGLLGRDSLDPVQPIFPPTLNNFRPTENVFRPSYATVKPEDPHWISLTKLEFLRPLVAPEAAVSI
jgi:hypothetical protein